MPKLHIGSLADFQTAQRHVLTLRKQETDDYLSIVLFKLSNPDGADRWYSIVKVWLDLTQNACELMAGQECPHLLAGMENAELEEIEETGDVLALCPWHQYDFSLTSTSELL